MLLGVLSDTHGAVDTTARAMEIFRQRQVRQVVHCGDVGGERILDLLAGEIPAAFVWGNSDYDHDLLKRYAEALGISCCDRVGRLTLDGSQIAFLHGDDHQMMRKLIEAQDCDLLFHGHSHFRAQSDVGRIRVINPGALYRARTKSVAIIDTDTRDAEFIEIP